MAVTASVPAEFGAETLDRDLSRLVALSASEVLPTARVDIVDLSLAVATFAFERRSLQEEKFTRIE
jgi:hypothetical protein